MKHVNFLKSVLFAVGLLLVTAISQAQTDAEKAKIKLDTSRVELMREAYGQRYLADKTIAEANQEMLDAKRLKDATAESNASKKLAIAQASRELAEKFIRDADSTADKQQSLIADFFSKDWGIGLAVLRYKGAVINDASLDANQIVRANNEQRWNTKLLLTKHFYFRHDTGQCWKASVATCWGPFLGVGLGGTNNSQVVDFVGTGFIFGFGKNKPNNGQSESMPHNIGIGFWGRQFGAKVLADDVSVNQKLPVGETQVRYKTTDLNAPFLFYTYQF